MEKYNKIYSASNTNEEVNPAKILNLIWKSFSSTSHIIDLGCGQGGDSLFLAKNRFKVTAIDSSNVAINQIKV